MTIYGTKTGKTLYTLTYSSCPTKHNHLAIVDAWDDGFTTVDAGHKHRIRNGVIVDAAGHGHKRADPDLVDGQTEAVA